MNLLTKMKSPSSSVGIIESDGMRNGSNRNERITSTIRMIGKNERAYSTSTGSAGSAPARLRAPGGAAGRPGRRAAQTRPVTRVATTSTNEKSKTKCHLAEAAGSIGYFPRRINALRRNGHTRRWTGPVRSARSFLAPDLQHRQERFLRDLHLPELLHALLALLLLLEELALAAKCRRRSTSPARSCAAP